MGDGLQNISQTASRDRLDEYQTQEGAREQKASEGQAGPAEVLKEAVKNGIGKTKRLFLRTDGRSTHRRRGL
jgi:hypothetical protein